MSLYRFSTYTYPWEASERGEKEILKIEMRNEYERQREEGRTTTRTEIGQESISFVASIVAGTTRRQVSLAVDGDYEKSTRVERQQMPRKR